MGEPGRFRLDHRRSGAAPFGFLAKVPTESGSVAASITRRAGLIVEEARSQDQLYANGRALSDDLTQIRPEVVAFRDTDGGGFAMTLQWRADDPIPPGYQPFLHFCNEGGAIDFQGGQDPTALNRERSGVIRAAVTGQEPAGVKPGTTFELRVGLYDAESGTRLALPGPTDGDSRDPAGPAPG